MAGTQDAVEEFPNYRVSTLRAASSTNANSLEGGFAVDTLTNASEAWVEDVGMQYRWDDTSLAAPSDPDVIIPLGQPLVVPGRWLVIVTNPDLVGDTNGPADANETNSLSPAVGGTNITLGDFTSDGAEVRPVVRSPAGGDIDTISLSTLATALTPFIGSGGQAQYLSADGDTVGLWTLNRTPTDSSGNGNDLVVNGLEAYASMCPGLIGAMFNGNDIWYETANVADVQLTGAMTLQLIAMSPTLEPLPSTRVLAGCRDATGAGDLLYQIMSNTTPTLRTIATGSGATPNPAHLLTTTPCLLTMTRNADVSVNQFYVNDQLLVTGGVGANPSANANAHLTVGRDPRGTLGISYFDGWICSVRLKDVFSDAAQVAADYNASLGPVYGTV